MADLNQIGKYVLLNELPETPLGRNFRAAELGASGLNRIVHLTRLVDEASPEVKFQQILQARFDGIRDLLHEGIVKPLEVSNISGVFISQEIVRGFSIKRVLNRSVKNDLPFSVDYALYTASKLCNTLEYAHSQNVANAPLLHGGLTTYNIYYTYEGDVKIMDWNIVACTDNMVSARNVFLQRYQLYLSPGQTEGRLTIPTSDVFQTGLIFYEMVTGSPLFTINRQENVERMTEKLYTDQRSIDGKPIPDEIIQILSKALALNPTLRYPTIKAMREDLDALLYSGTYLATATKTSFFLNSVFKEEIRITKENMEKELSLDYAPYITKMAEPESLPLGVEEVSAEEISAQILPEAGTLSAEAEGLEIESDDDFKSYTRKRDLPIKAMIGAAVAVIIAIVITVLVTGGGEMEIAPVQSPDAAIREQEMEAMRAERDELQTRTQAIAAERDQAQERTRILEDAQAIRERTQATLAEEEKRMQASMDEGIIRKEEERKIAEQARRDEQARLARMAAALDSPSGSASTSTPPPAVTATTQPAATTPSDSGTTPTTTTPSTGTAVAATTPEPVTPGIPIIQATSPGLQMTLTKRVAPRYPRSLRRSGIRRRGTVRLLVTVSTDGTVESAKVLAGNAVFHDEATRAIRRWRWTPPTRNGKPVKVSLVVAINF